MARPSHFDVAVVGGGSAGVAAAVSAARSGARSLLVERSDVLGGNVGNAFVHTICGLYLPAEQAEAQHAHPGFPQRFAEGLRAAGAAGSAERAGRVWVLPIEPPGFAEFAAKLCAGTPGLEVRMRSELVAATLAAEGAAPQAITLRSEGAAESRFTAGVLVDASGDASLGWLGGAEVAEASAEDLQLPSLIFKMGGVDTSELSGFARLRLTHAVAGAVRSLELPEGCESVLVRPGAATGEVYLTLNVPRPERAAYAPLDPAQLAALEQGARESAVRIADFLRRTRPAFAASRIEAWPRRIGVRETRRLAGAALLARGDVLEGRAHVDQVATSTWPIELWHDHRRASFEYPVRPCSIPLGALVSRSHPRLGMAGRCLSATHEALGALRVVGTALATGEAVGIAAALAADAGIALGAVPAGEVRRKLLALAGQGDA
ncbi:MAG TPA: FAD-dependent oxidoreductase [Myxococcota bacterium]